MTVTALITEYNPFHNGHAYHIEEARRITNADFIIAVMSGNFVQRGEPAVFDKSARTKAALCCGADLVLELPVRFACGSAEFFASGAISLLNGLGCVDYLCFGSEAGNLSALSEIAGILAAEPAAYKILLQDALKTGVSFPAARETALVHLFDTANTGICKLPRSLLSISSEQIHELLSQPNNILGLEYIKALKKTGSSIRPVTIRRIGSGYHDEEAVGKFASATALRKQIFEKPRSSELLHLLTPYIPPAALTVQTDGRNIPVCADDFSQMLLYRLLMAADWQTFADCFDVPEDLARRIFSMRYDFKNITGFTEQLQTRNHTAPSVRRALLHILLQMPAKPVIRHAHYARILGFRKNSAAVLREIKEKGHLPLLSKPADAPSVLARLQNPQAELLFAEDIRSSELYTSAAAAKTGTTGRSEFTRPVVVL